MGCLSGIKNVVLGFIPGYAEKAQRLSALETAKKGKTDEQKRVIDFFCADENGCLDGCLGKSRINVMSLDEYLSLVDAKIKSLNLKQKALDKIGLDEEEISEIAPIQLSSFIFGDSNTFEKYFDTMAVSSKFSVSWIFFSATQVYTYNYIFNMDSDDTFETTKDFFYKDVTCFSTFEKVREKIDIDVLGCIKKGETVTKKHIKIDTFEIIVPGKSYSFTMRDNDTMEESLQAAKSMLREKKLSL